jgi:hypothetical protein
MADNLMTDQTDTPVATLAAATRESRRSRGRMTLVGTMHGPSVGRALLRHGGKVHVLQVGDRIDRATVTAIGEGVITLSRGGRTERLRLPID